MGKKTRKYLILKWDKIYTKVYTEKEIEMTDNTVDISDYKSSRDGDVIRLHNSFVYIPARILDDGFLEVVDYLKPILASKFNITFSDVFLKEFDNISYFSKDRISEYEGLSNKYIASEEDYNDEKAVLYGILAKILKNDNYIIEELTFDDDSSEIIGDKIFNQIFRDQYGKDLRNVTNKLYNAPDKNITGTGLISFIRENDLDYKKLVFHIEDFPENWEDEIIIVNFRDTAHILLKEEFKRDI